MSQRSDTTKYLCYLLVLYAVPSWSPVQGVTVKTPPKNPTSIEAQAKFFQDFFSVQLSPYKIEFGHVCEDPNTWEQRYEKKDFKNHRDMGKVRWGDQKGGYGEHYWDLNHAGHAGNHDDGDDGRYHDHSDDGSYHHDDDNSNQGYDGSNEHSSPYTDSYDPEKASYEESGRAKRAHPKIKPERKIKPHKEVDQEEEVYTTESHPVKSKNRKHTKKEQLQEAPSHHVEKYSNEDDNDDSEEEVYKPPKRPHHRQSQVEEEDQPQPKEPKNQVVLVVKEKERIKQQQNPYQTTNQAYSQFVPYEGGAGVRQHQQPEVSASAPVPRLFLEPTTGHVVDRATGQAYVLQPIAATNNYN